MLRRRELRPLGAVALLGVVLACLETAGGVPGSLLHLAPLLVLVLPLLAGRYVGEERLAALAAVVRRRRTRPVVRRARSTRRSDALVARGGLLLACALGRRGPPALIAAR